MSSPHYKGSNLPNAEQHIHGKEDHVIIKPVALDITWGGNSRYWLIKDTAELVQVTWLEVNGSLDMQKYLKPGTKYKLEFRVGLKPNALGWDDNPVYIMVKPGNGNYIWKKADLTSIKERIFTIPFASRLEFTTPASGNDKLTFGLYEIWTGRWKGGLVIEEVVISLV